MPNRWLTVFVLAALLVVAPVALAHEGHDHDKPAPLNLPVAPRVVSVTPEFELVAVLSGKSQLTIFLTSFATNKPVQGAKMAVSADSDTVEAEARDDGVFVVSAPWISSDQTASFIFALTLRDGAQDLLTGTLEAPPTTRQVESSPQSTPELITRFIDDPWLAGIGAGGFVLGVLLTLLLAGRRARREAEPAVEGSRAVPASNQGRPPAKKPPDAASTRRRHRQAKAATLMTLAMVLVWSASGPAASANLREAPSIPSTMATDVPQRMPDGTVFVPKATQHLLSVRTMLVTSTSAARSIELSGMITAGPKNLGRVQSGHPGRIEARDSGLPHIGMRVEKGELLGYVKTYIEAADRAQMDSQIAETEARIAKHRTILSRLEKAGGAVPQIKLDEVRGEIEALIKKRAELIPSLSERQPMVAPIGGVVSATRVAVGQIVEPRDVLFEIVDPSEFWVEAVSTNPNVANGIDKAVVVVDGADPMPLEFAGRGLALRHHSAVLNFKIKAETDMLSVGQIARVVLQTNSQVSGFVIPTSAVLRGQTGLPIVWIKTEAERFEAQTVKADPLDGKSVVVTAGLKPDQRVVVEGATLLNQVR